MKNDVNFALFSEIDALSEEYIDRWVNLCSIESPTEYKAGVDASVEYLVNIAKGLGFSVERAHFEKSGDPAMITVNAEAKGAPIVLSGHLDTVHPIGLFGQPPVRVDRENDTVYGPGVADCKGGVVAALLATHALKNIGFTDRPVKLLLQTDEETSSRESRKGTINWICEKAQGAEAFLNLEAHPMGEAVVERKGIMRYAFEISGIAVHASRCFVGVSAIAEAAAKISELEKQKDKDGITCSVGTVAGGNAENTVPDACRFTLDVRFNDEVQRKSAEALVERVANTAYVPGATCKLTLLSARPSMPKEKRNYDLLAKMNEIYEKWGLPVLKPRISRGGSDAAEVTIAGIPCVDSIGVTGEWYHSPKECARLSSLAEAAKRLATVIVSL